MRFAQRGRRAKGIGFAVVCLVTLVVGCGGGGEAPAPLVVPPDVAAAMTTGSAEGQAFAGTYQMDAAAADGCVCRVGSCADLRTDSAAFLSLSMDNGAFMLEYVRGGWRGLPCVGGIDADGTFSCGDIMGDSLFVVDGKISSEGGAPTSLSMVEKETIRETDQTGEAFDCDIRMTVTAHVIQ